MQRKIRVIHLVELNGLGGVQEAFRSYEAESHESCDLVHCVYSPNKPASIFYNLNVYELLFFSVIGIFSKRIIFHFYNSVGSKKVYWFLRFFRLRSVVLHEHGNAWNLDSRNSKYFRENVRASSLTIANSKAAKSMLVQKFGCCTQKISVIYNGLNLEKGQVRIKRACLEGQFTLGYLGRLEPLKSVETLLFCLVYPGMEDVRLVVAGDGVSMKFLHDLAGELNVVDRVEFAGRVEPSTEFFPKVDLLVVPSIREPFGNVAPEALSAGIPIIAANVDGLPEVVGKGYPEFVLDRFSDEALEVSILSKNWPSHVVNPSNLRLKEPRRLSVRDLVERISWMREHPDLAEKLTRQWNKERQAYFLVKRYADELKQAYVAIASD